MIRELIVMLFESVLHGDFAGHMRAWWDVATGRIALENQP